MFQLYKKRDFSTFLSDTIDFFKGNFKNYFGNFITITGALLVVLCVIFFFIFKDLFDTVLSNSGNSEILGTYLQDNLAQIILLGGIGFIVAIVFTCITMSFPVAYLQLMNETGRDSFTSSELFEQMKGMLVRVVIFSLLSILIIFPLAIIAFFISVALIFLIIGVPLMIILFPAIYIFISQSLYVYLTEDEGYFDSLGRGWKILFSKKFWPVIGNTVVVYIVIGILQSILPMIPYFFMIGSALSAGDAASKLTGMTAPMITLYILSIVSSYFFQNILIINQGLIYYSSLEQETNTQALSEIDSIGQDAK
jgi:hypothetical protein